MNNNLKLYLIVFSVAFLPSLIKVRAISINTRSEPIVLVGHNDSIFALKQLRDGNLASGSLDKTVILWNLTNSKSPIYAILKGHTDSITSLSVLLNGDLASGSCDWTIKIWDTIKGFLKRTLKGHKECVIDVATLGDGILASASFDDTIKLWNADSGALVRTLYGHLNYVETLAVLKNGYLASGSQDMRIKVWNVRTGFPIKTIRTHHFLRLLFVLNSGDLVSCYDQGPMQIWDPMEGIVKMSINVSIFDMIFSLTQLSGENGDLVGGCLDTSIKIWNLKTGEIKRTLNGHNSTVFAVIMLNDGRLASSSADRTIRIWDI
jgi:WD40 repeat protein